MGSISSRRHSGERPSSRRPTRWFGTIELVRANQNADRPVSTRPLSGISVGSTTSKTEMRSLATSSSRSSSSAYSSRTLPLPRWIAVSDMHGLPVGGERAEALEDDVDVLHGRGQIEHALQCGRVEARRNLRVGKDELAE